MYCGNCGKQIQTDMSFCPECGAKIISKPPVPQQIPIKKKKSNKKIKIVAVCLALVIVAVSVFSFVRKRTYLSGTYESLTGDWTFVLKQKTEDSGTFELYIDGESPDEDNIRYTKTWEKDGDILTLEYDDDTTWYFFIADGGLIGLEDEDEEPKYSEYVAPKGKTFDYEIDRRIFHKNGTYENKYYESDSGNYYCQNNVIYCYENYYVGYLPEYWIYNDDCITSAYDVYIKK